jgi:hypothetical protein
VGEHEELLTDVLRVLGYTHRVLLAVAIMVRGDGLSAVAIPVMPTPTED